MSADVGLAGGATRWDVLASLMVERRRAGSSEPLAAFFDESGTDRTKTHFVVAGYLAPLSRWEQFDERWLRMLRQERVLAFHRTDMEWPFHREFEKWRARPDRKEHQVAILKACHRIIRETHIRAVAYGVNLAAYRKLVGRHPLREYLGTPYYVAAGVCVEALADWAARNAYQGPIAYFFEDGAEGIGRALAGVRHAVRGNKGVRLIETLKKEDARPLQAADFLAYEYCKYLEEDGRPPRKSILGLVDDRRSEFSMIDPDGIKAALARIASRRPFG